MAVAFVRATQGTSTTDTLTLNIQSSGTDRILVVGLAYKSNNPQTPISIVFNGTENFTLELAGTDAADAQCFLYYLTGPTVTTADVVITMPGSGRAVGYVALFTGVNQTNPFTANTVDAQGNDAAPTVTVNSAGDEICVDIMAQVSGGPDTAIAAHTEICNGAATGGGTDTRGAGQYVAGQASRVMNYSMSDSDDWNIVAGALQEPSAGVTHYGAATLAGIGTVVAAGVRIFTGAATLAGVGAIAAIAQNLCLAAVALSGIGTLVASAVGTFIGKATITGVGILSTIGQRIVSGVATLSGVGSLAAIGTVGGVIRYGVATLSGVGSVAALAVCTLIGKATAVGTGMVSAIGRRIVTGMSTLAGAGVLSAAGSFFHYGASTLSGVGSITVTGVRVFLGKATLAGVGTLSALGRLLHTASATLSGVGNLAGAGRGTFIGTATLVGVGIVAVIGMVVGGGETVYINEEVNIADQAATIMVDTKYNIAFVNIERINPIVIKGIKVDGNIV